MRAYIKHLFFLFIGAAAFLCNVHGFNSNINDGDLCKISLASASAKTIVLGFNDLGMHCMDREFSVFCMLPPFNVIHAQVVMQDSNGRPFLANNSRIKIAYNAVADPAGSINSFSIGKTDFWLYADMLFGTVLEPGQGLTGRYMPEDNPQSPGPQVFSYQASRRWFTADGIPITPLDDSMNINPYPLMRITASDPSGLRSLAYLDVVVPVSEETDCLNCHKTGGIASGRTNINWSGEPDIEIASKINILKLHDFMEGTDLKARKPVLCASCHYSAALDLEGAGITGNQAGHRIFSRTMHNYHGKIKVNKKLIFSPASTADQTCYQCHPGKITKCLRDVMKIGGIGCYDCHGNMLAVGGAYNLLPGGSIDGKRDGKTRRPWKDLPRCQSCHTGDAVDHLNASNLAFDTSGIRLIQAYAINDPSASPLLAINKRFAENDNKLYRNSKGHGNISCEGCHGSTHAIWRTKTANDNIAARQLQKHAGPIIECNTCHAAGSLPLTINGPHGLHNVNDKRWVGQDTEESNGSNQKINMLHAEGDHHHEFYENDPDNCRACHGVNLTGSPLAKAANNRVFQVEDGTVRFSKNQQIRCDMCHSIPE